MAASVKQGSEEKQASRGCSGLSYRRDERRIVTDPARRLTEGGSRRQEP